VHGAVHPKRFMSSVGIEMLNVFVSDRIRWILDTRFVLYSTYMCWHPRAPLAPVLADNRRRCDSFSSSVRTLAAR
jgi:hypothetical protein